MTTNKDGNSVNQTPEQNPAQTPEQNPEQTPGQNPEQKKRFFPTNPGICRRGCSDGCGC